MAHAPHSRHGGHARNARRGSGRQCLDLADRWPDPSSVLVRSRPAGGRAAPRRRSRCRDRSRCRRAHRWRGLVRRLGAQRRSRADDPDRRRVCGDVAPTRFGRGGSRGGRRRGIDRGSGRRERRRHDDASARPPRRSSRLRPRRLRRPARLPAGARQRLASSSGAFAGRFGAGYRSGGRSCVTRCRDGAHGRAGACVRPDDLARAGLHGLSAGSAGRRACSGRPSRAARNRPGRNGPSRRAARGAAGRGDPVRTAFGAGEAPRSRPRAVVPPSRGACRHVLPPAGPGWPRRSCFDTVTPGSGRSRSCRHEVPRQNLGWYFGAAEGRA